MNTDMERFFFDEADFQHNFASALSTAIDFASSSLALGYSIKTKRIL